jgi:Zn-finger nucleic acid-binding protein
MELTCPKCHGTMRTYERNGVHVDQCSDCRGIFLDRGELDRLVDAENAWHGGARGGTERTEHRDRDDHEYRDQHRDKSSQLGSVVNDVLSQVRGQKQSSSSYGHGHQRRKKESFLDDLFG